MSRRAAFYASAAIVCVDLGLLGLANILLSWSIALRKRAGRLTGTAWELKNGRPHNSCPHGQKQGLCVRCNQD